jgi:hypothetical protein
MVAMVGFFALTASAFAFGFSDEDHDCLKNAVNTALLPCSLRIFYRSVDNCFRARLPA